MEFLGLFVPGALLIEIAWLLRYRRGVWMSVKRLGLFAFLAAASACGRQKDLGADTGAASSSGAEAAAATVPSLLREEALVRVGGGTEQWMLVWRRPPVPACAADAAVEALTCPCDGFAYGEQGELDLLRRHTGRPDERLALTPLFGEGENPAWQKQLAVLQRWPVRAADYSAMDSPGLAAGVRARPITRAIALGDYDHDGQATEFLLQVGASPCGHRAAVLVGVSATDTTLHAFTSRAHRERPLVLEPSTWELLLRPKGRAAGVEWKCGDHGAETQTEVSLRVGPEGIDGTRDEYQCSAHGARGRLVRSTRI